MLTFFEYLRQRALESVLAGAEEALELLETQGFFERPAARIADQRPTIDQNVAATEATAKDSPEPPPNEPQSQPAEHVAKTKPPRKRKRSKRKGSRQ